MLSVGSIPCFPQILVSEEQIRAANDKARQLDSCKADGFLMSVIAKSLDNQNKILSDSLKIKDAQKLKLSKKVKNRNKTMIGSLVVNVIFFAFLLLK